MKTTIVHVNDSAGFDVYIGRAVPRRRLRESVFANPFKIGEDGDRGEVIEKYRAWLLDRPTLVERARLELRGKRLGCWCRHEGELITPGNPCHGDVLAEICDG